MNINELKEELVKKGIPQSVYNINSGGLLDQKMCLVNENGKWKVFYSERGKKFDYAEFDDENDACAELYKRL